MGIGNLPEGWEWKTVGEISESINPGFPSGKHNQENIGVPHIRPMNISRNGEIDLSQVKYVEETQYSPLMEGDVLFNNTNSPELVGKTTYIPKDTNWAYSNHMTRIRLRREIAYPAWVAKSLHYLYLDGFFKLNCRHHVNQASIASGYLSKEVFIPLPPLSEQERIVSRIEELFSDLEAGVAALERVRAGLRRYKASVLKAAVEGKLLENRGVERSGQLPEGWRWVTVEELSDGSRYAMKAGPFGSSLKKEYYVPRGYKIYGQEQVIRGDPQYGDYYINEERYQLLKSNAVKPGDVLVSLVGTIGKVLILPENIEPGIINPRLVKLSFDKNLVDRKYFKIYMETETAKHYFSTVSHGETMAILNLGILKKLPIPLPPLDEQRRIVAEVERRLSVVREVESAVEAGLARAGRLRQAVLRSAFEGRL